MKKPTRKHLNRRITTDSIDRPTKADLQILVCALNDDLREARKELEHYENAYNGGKNL